MNDNMNDLKQILELKKQIEQVFNNYINRVSGTKMEPTWNQSGTKTEPEKQLPEDLEKELTPQGIYLVKHMLQVGMYETSELYKKGIKNSIRTNEKTILERNLSREAVNKCIDRVMSEVKKGTVKNVNSYFQTSLQRLPKND